MKTVGSVRFIRYTLFIASLVCMAWLSALPAQAAELLYLETSSSAPMKEFGVVASGAVEDTLKACLARIPKDASAGQRMMAEQSCDRDEDGRKSIQAVPGR